MKRNSRFSLVVLTLSILTLSTASAENSSWMKLFGDLSRAPFARAKAAPIPAEYQNDFALVEPQVDGTENRAPASQPAARMIGKRNPHAPVAAAKPVSAPATAGSAKSRLPATVDAGVEVRMRTAQDAATFWVVRRAEKFNLLYSNSGGTKSSLDISESQFGELLDAAREAQSVREPSSVSGSGCHGSIVQLFVVAKAHAEQAKTVCVDPSHKPSAAMNKLGFMLSSFVR